MIADIDQFKLDRSYAIKSRDLITIRAFALKYGVILPVCDKELFKLLDKITNWI